MYEVALLTEMFSDLQRCEESWTGGTCRKATTKFSTHSWTTQSIVIHRSRWFTAQSVEQYLNCSHFLIDSPFDVWGVKVMTPWERVSQSFKNYWNWAPCWSDHTTILGELHNLPARGDSLYKLQGPSGAYYNKAVLYTKLERIHQMTCFNFTFRLPILLPFFFLWVFYYTVSNKQVKLSL
jgi:hypothetical protein